MSYRGPKVKKSRRLGVPLTRKASAVMVKKPYGPGQHGQRRRRGMSSDYSKQLLEKQRLRFQFDISEKKLRRYFKEAKSTKGNTAENLIQTLECRLDNFIFRAGLCNSIYQAKQVVSHGHVEVNGKKVDKRSFHIKLTDIVTIKEKSKTLSMFKASLNEATIPNYIETDRDNYTVRFIAKPNREDIPVICDVQQVVEFYSR